MPRLLNLGLAALLLLLTVPAQHTTAQSGEPSRAPVLRIETGMHTAIIRRIGVDAANRYLVTASEDKTVRVWELPSGRPLRVIRVPLGAGNEGKLYAVAISPDGNTIAAGGWTGYEWEKTTSIYLFDRASGRLTRRLGGLPSAVLHLAYSPDGRFLAATLGDGAGVRVFSTAAFALAGEDRDYGNHSSWAEFDRAGRLATTSEDGFIRLYATERDGSLRLVAKQSAAGGKNPRGVSFSPDGARLAVGFRDSTNVAVLSTRDLSLLYAPDTRGSATTFPDGRGGAVTTYGIIYGNLSYVAWSADGGTLYAGGEFSDIHTEFGANTRKYIRAWSDGGRGSHRDITVEATNSITHIVPLLGGGLVYGASGPSFGLIDASDRRAFVTEMAVANHRGLGTRLLLARDGAGVQFGYEQNGNSPARFSLADRRLEAAPSASSDGWRAPITESERVRLTDLNGDDYGPKLNGTTLSMTKDGARLALNVKETRHSFAFSPDNEHLLLGTDWNIRLFTRDGRERWNAPAPGAAYAVNISDDGRVAVAAYGDGTIRWHSMKDGKELLAFFPHADRKRWVAWTPSGYYDASTGAEELIGWHVNNNRDAAADFFPVGQFRNVYYRPDVISKVLATGDEMLALKQANDEAGNKEELADVARLLPPVVEIVSPSDGAEVRSNEVSVRFQLRTPSGEPVTEVRALIDGRPANVARGVKLQATKQTGNARALLITVPDGESQVSIIASNRFTSSVPATVRVRVRKSSSFRLFGGIRPSHSPATIGEAFEITPKLYVLAVGVSNYADKDLTLAFAAKDAQDFAATWERQKGVLYRDVVVKLLTDEHATKDEILDGLDWIRKETTSKDVAMVLFAGHGVNDQNRRYYFLPHNADREKLLRTGVSFEDIKSTVASLAGKTLFFIDTCRSGSVFGGRRGINDTVGVINELASAENGAVVFASSTGNQYSLENPAWNNGAFTLAVIEGVNGGADYVGKGRITVNMLDLYISERVKELTKGQQTPTTAKPNTIPDFPVALKK